MSSFTKLILHLMLLVSCINIMCNATRVEIRNDLESGSDLLLHCKSKDDDLGFHVVPLGWMDGSRIMMPRPSRVAHRTAANAKTVIPAKAGIHAAFSQ